jgi:hypothetical protein
MKTSIKLSLLLFLSTIILSCNPDEEIVTPPGTPTVTFNCYLDGVNYTYTGNYGQGAGTSAGTLQAGFFSLVLSQPIAGGYQPFGVTFILPMNAPQTGTIIFGPMSSTNGVTVMTQSSPGSVMTASNSAGGQVTMNITEFGTTSYTTNPQNPGRIKGNFSGTIEEGNGTAHSISGTFDSIRII